MSSILTTRSGIFAHSVAQIRRTHEDTETKFVAIGNGEICLEGRRKGGSYSSVLLTICAVHNHSIHSRKLDLRRPVLVFSRIMPKSI